MLSKGVSEDGGGSELHVITRKKLVEAETKYSIDLDGWYRVAKGAKWKNLQEVRDVYANVDGVPIGDRVYTVFNISGNSYRLVTEIYYEDQTILIRHVLTHAEYDKDNWKQ